MIAALDQLWTQLLKITESFVIPDWGSLVALLPVFLLLGVVGPLVTLLALAWLVYVVCRPRTRVRFAEGATPAALEAGVPVFPPGRPYCARHALVHQPGDTRCEVDGETLAVVCPMCGLGREADVDTCGNCGLVLKVVPRARALRPAGPPPGGAAVA
ncbi:MAG TPA: hypothetical protein VEY67_01640 [Candidatus Dormibacteraeota bacterium]|nr:hypothetical protein [Candidatus Dormibacteraeota bacterium]